MSLIQTDCAINSGNSGGGLFNLYGELVGITNAKYSTNGLTQATIDNIGFAIPISDVKHIIEGIITKGEFERPYIGVSVTNATENSETKEPAGAKIDSVEKDLAADKAGIKKGDIITKFGDYDVKNINDLRGAVKKYQKGDKITVTLYRNGKHLTIELVMTVLVQPALPQA